MKEFVEKLIGRLEEEKEAYSDTTYYALGVGSAIKIVNQLAEEMGASKMENTTWIPCSERLPEESGKYLVTVKNLTGYWIMENNVFVCDYQYGKFIFQGWEDNEVVYWQPLPDAPKESSTADVQFHKEQIGDLISRSELLKKFCINSKGERIPEVDCDNIQVTVSIKDIKRIIREEPTACDMGK